MRSFANYILIATAYLTLDAHALPRPALSYSVVNVDGGSQTPPSTLNTVYQTVTESSNSEKTVSVTVVETPSSTPVVDVPTTVYQTEHGEATETALIPEASLPVQPPHRRPDPPSPPGNHPPAHIPNADPAPTHESVSVVTVVSVTTATPTTTTSYYDNGMWHTSYAIETSATGECTSSSSPTGPTPYTYTRTIGTGVSFSGRVLPTGYRSMGWNSTMH